MHSPNARATNLSLNPCSRRKIRRNQSEINTNEIQEQYLNTPKATFTQNMNTFPIKSIKNVNLTATLHPRFFPI